MRRDAEQEGTGGPRQREGASDTGDDADTTGAVYGQLAGAYYGAEGIPEEWRAKLVKRDDIERLAAALWAAARSGPD